jgi:pimeloyl-ACP methyl ester carboxylesterase
MKTPQFAAVYPVEEEDIFFRSHDDLMLHVRRYGREDLPARPLLCLPGLTRTARDFDSLALALAAHPTNPRPVYCADYRGRGYSEWDKDWRNYSAYIELLDVISFLTLRGLNNMAILGTSRGSIIAMLLAVLRPSSIGCLIMNDIGPVIETAGLARIMGYAGKIPIPRDWGEANAMVREMNRRHFTALSDEAWEALTYQVFNEKDGKPAPAYDPNVGKALSEVDIAKPVPTMWEHFAALLQKPVMVLRGEHSDILSQATVKEMQARHPGLAAVLVRNEGHAPLLLDRFTQRLIADFLAEHDRGWASPVPALQPAIRELVKS